MWRDENGKDGRYRRIVRVKDRGGRAKSTRGNRGVVVPPRQEEVEDRVSHTPVVVPLSGLGRGRR